MTSARWRTSVGLAIALLPFSHTLAQPCVPHFAEGYDFGTLHTPYMQVSCAATFGAEPTLYIGGRFIIPESGVVNLAKFAGGRWHAVGSPLDGSPFALTVFDMGNGPELFMAGSFTRLPDGQPASNLARWNGTTWTAIPGIQMTAGGHVTTLLGVQEASGPVLYMAGSFATLNGTPVTDRVSKWDGSTIQVVGNGTFTNPSHVRSLASFDTGGGPKLYAAGDLRLAGGVAAGVAVLNGSTWEPVGVISGSGGLPAAVTPLAVHDDGDGADLYVGGRFDTAEGTALVAKLVDGRWARVLEPGPELQTCVSLRSQATAQGPMLVASIGQTNNIVREIQALRAGTWDRLGTVTSDVYQPHATVLTSHPTTSNLAVLGAFTAVSSTRAASAAHWDGAAWTSFEPVGLGGLDLPILVDPADESSAYVGTYRWAAGGPSPSDLPATPSRLLRLQRPVSTRVVVGANGTVYIEGGSGWSTLMQLNAKVWMAADGDTDTLVSQGNDYRLRRWVNGAWTPIGQVFGQGAGPFPFPPIMIEDVMACDHGSGPVLYAAGTLGTVSGVPNTGLAALVNGQWQPIAGVSWVRCLAVHDLGEGPELVVSALGNGILRWNGTRLLEANAGLPPDYTFASFRAMDIGFGQRLFGSSLVPGNPLRFWNGTAWEPVPQVSVSDGIRSMASLRAADGSRSLLITGPFLRAGETYSAGIAELVGCPHTCSADFDGDGDFGTDGDIESFFRCLGGTCCATCGSVDFNNDGDFGTDADIEAFFRVLAGGAC